MSRRPESECVYRDVSVPMFKTYLEEYRYERQRQVSEPRIQYLAYQHSQGRLIGKIIYVVLAYYKRDQFMINAYHTSNACIRIAKGLKTNVHRIRADTANEVDLLYSMYDRNKPRNISDAINAHRIDIPLPAGDISTITAALPVILNGFRVVGGQASARNLVVRDQDVLVKAAEHFAPLALLYYDMLHKLEKDARKPFSNAGILATAMLCYLHRPDQAAKFWSQVINPTDAKEGSPAFALNRRLTTIALGGQQQMAKRLRLRPHVYATLCSYAWNAFIEGDSMTMAKLPKQSNLGSPLLLKGTPYDGKDFILPTIPGVDLHEELVVAEQFLQNQK